MNSSVNSNTNEKTVEQNPKCLSFLNNFSQLNMTKKDTEMLMFNILKECVFTKKINK